MSQSTQNGLKRIKMQKMFFTPFMRFARSAAQPYLPLRSLHSLGLRARYLPHDTPRVPRSVHAKFHHDRIKIMGARGIQTYIDRYIDSPSVTVALS